MYYKQVLMSNNRLFDIQIVGLYIVVLIGEMVDSMYLANLAASIIVDKFCDIYKI